MQQLQVSRFVPYLVSIFVFYVVTLLFFQPEILENKSLSIDDTLKGSEMARELSEHREETGETAMWTGTMFGGMPATMISLQEFFSPMRWIKAVHNGLVLPYTAQSFFSYLIGMFVLLLSFRVNPYWAMAGALVFGLTSYNLIIIEVGHMWKVNALSSAGFVLAGMQLAFSRKYVWGFVLAAVGTALELRANHAQITYYLLFVIFCFALVMLIEAARNKQLPEFGKSVVVLVLAALLGLSTNIGRLWSMYEYSQYSTRGEVLLDPISEDGQEKGDAGVGTKSYAFSWSQGIAETGTLLIPYLYGGSSQEKLRTDSEMYQTIRRTQMPQNQKNYLLNYAPLYFGDQPFTAGPVYAGAITCFLFVLGLFFVRRQTRIWILTGAIILTFIAWGRNFSTLNYFLFDYFPLFNKFRAVAMALSLTVLLMVLGAFLGTKELLEVRFSKKNLQYLLIAFGLTGGLSLLIYLMAGSMTARAPGEAERFGAGLSELLQAERRDLIRSDALRSFALITLAAAAIYLFWKETIKSWLLLLILGVLAVGDVWQVGKRYLNHESFSRDYKQARLNPQPTPADQRILQDKDLHYRVLPLMNPFNDSEAARFHKTIGGYSPAKLRRYQDFVERRLSPEVQQLSAQLQQGKADFSAFKGINMMNTRYVMGGPSADQVIQNPEAYGVAWFVSQTKAVDSEDEEMQAIGGLTATQPAFSLQNGEDLQQTAVFSTQSSDLSPKSYFKNDSLQSVHLTDYQANSLTYEITTPEPAFVVFSEVYYPKGWEVSLNEQPAAFKRVNYFMRGMEVPAGTHKLHCVFRPDSYYLGMRISQISSYLLFVVVLLAIGWGLRSELKAA